MNSRFNKSDSDHELSSSARVSARSRFSAPPAAAFPSPSVSTSKSKGGINGRAYDSSSDEDELGLSSRSSLRTAAKRSSSNSSNNVGAASVVTRSKELGLSSQRSNGSAAASSSKDRPWRTGGGTTSGSGDYELGGRNRSADSARSAESVEVSAPAGNRWSQYETEDLEEESRRATGNAVVDVATRFADRQAEEGDNNNNVVVDVEGDNEQEPMIEATTEAPMGGAPGTGYADEDPWAGGGETDDRGDLRALEDNGNSLPAAMPHRDDGAGRSSDNNGRSAKDYVKSRLSSLVPHRNRASDNDYERNLSVSTSTNKTSDHDKVRNEALMMLQIADSCLQDSPRNSLPGSPGSSINGLSGNTAGLFRTSTGGLAMRELHDNEAEGIRMSQRQRRQAQAYQQAGQGSTEGSSAREKASSIAGLNDFKSEKGARFDGTFTIGSHDEEDSKQHSNNNDPAENKSGSWSSRYSVERQLMAITGGLDSTHMLAKMDMLHSNREKTKSARGLYRASGYAMDGSGEEYNDYTKGSSSGLGLGGMWMRLRGTLWSDDLELNYDGTTQSLVRREKAMRRRRRFRWMALFFVGLSVAVGVCVHFIQNPKVAAAMGGEGDVNFYVLADEPFDLSDVDQLTRELEALPSNAEFVIHLGNANGDVQSRCQEYGFERAAAIFAESPVPVLVIPGDLDWAACGNKRKAQAALEYWDINLGKFERKWDDNRLDVDYSDDVVGNFRFLHKGVLFISVSILDAETEPNEVSERLEQNVMWTKGQLSEFRSSEYNAVVIFGHAPPSSKQGEYFLPVMDEIKDLNKPVLYLHANSDDGSFEQYTPYTDAMNFRAVQLEKRGREGPMRVMVNGDDGSRDYDEVFEFERRDPAMERIEK